jgi:hypothetical protein
MDNQEKRSAQLREAKRRQRQRSGDNGITQLNISLEIKLINAYKQMLKEDHECKSMDNLVAKALEHYLQRNEAEKSNTLKDKELYTLEEARKKIEEIDEEYVITDETTIEEYREHMIHFFKYDPFNGLSLLDITSRALQFAAIKDPGKFLLAYKTLQDPVIQSDLKLYLKLGSESLSKYEYDLFEESSE